MFQNQDIRDFVELLGKHKVRFVLIGGYAVIHYTQPRYTKDIDFLIEASESSAEQVVSALEEFGVPRAQINKNIFTEEGNFFKIGKPPWRIDLITSVKGISFADILRDSITEVFDGIPIKIVSKNHLILLKEHAGRPVDLIDLEALKRQ